MRGDPSFLSPVTGPFGRLGERLVELFEGHSPNRGAHRLKSEDPKGHTVALRRREIVQGRGSIVDAELLDPWVVMSDSTQLRDPEPGSPPPSQGSAALAADRSQGWIRVVVWSALGLGILVALAMALL